MITTYVLRLQRAEETGSQGPDIDPLCYADLESLIMPMEGLLILGLRKCNRESQFQIPELSSPELKCQGAPPHRPATSGRTKVCHSLCHPNFSDLIGCVADYPDPRRVAPPSMTKSSSHYELKNQVPIFIPFGARDKYRVCVTTLSCTEAN